MDPSAVVDLCGYGPDRKGSWDMRHCLALSGKQSWMPIAKLTLIFNEARNEDSDDGE